MSVIQDLRFAVRGFARTPGFTLSVIGTIALAIGANSTIFSVVNGVLLRPLPYGNPEGIVTIWSRWNVFPKTWVSIQEYQQYSQGANSLADLALFGTSFGVNLTDGDEPARATAVSTTPNLFNVLGVRPALGRTFTEAEARENRDVVMLSHGVWQRRYGGDPDVVGSTIEINGRAQLVVGVLPPGFRVHVDFGDSRPTDIWAARFVDVNGSATRRNGGSHSDFVVGRLVPGATVAQARAEIRTVAQRMIDEGVYPKEMQFEPLVLSVTDDVLGTVRPALVVLLAAVGFVLLIACANVANLLLSRNTGRVREIAVRTVLGAGRGRLAQQLLTESMVLTIAGGVLGLGLSFAAIRALGAIDPAGLPRLANVRIDLAVLAFTAGVSILTGVLFSLLPAFRGSRAMPNDDLKAGGRTASTSAGHHRTQGFLVVTESALTIVLLIGAGLMIRTFAHLQAIDPGFKSENVLTMQISVPSSSYPDPGDVTQFFERVTDAVGELPGVRNASAVRILPLATQIGDWGTQVEGYQPQPGESMQADWQIATPGYFEAMGIPLIRGRYFTRDDRTEGRQVLIVNETFADKYWPNETPIGKRVFLGGDSTRLLTTVVGVVGDVTHNGITTEIKRKWYRPHTQFHRTGFLLRSMTLVIKTESDPLTVVRSIRTRVKAMDSKIPLANIQTLDGVLSDSVAQSRFTMLLLALFAGMALVLAVVGVYGVLSYTMSRRTREIGVRMALGARTGQVIRLVVQQGMVMAGAGLVAGTVGAVFLTRFMAGFLYGVESLDLMTFVAVPGLFVVVALLACYLPARRAARVNPAVALRSE